MIIWLYLRFSSITAVKSLKIFTVCEICLADHLKAEKKIGVTKEVSSLFTILCFLPPSQIWSYEFFFIHRD